MWKFGIANYIYVICLAVRAILEINFDISLTTNWSHKEEEIAYIKYVSFLNFLNFIWLFATEASSQ